MIMYVYIGPLLILEILTLLVFGISMAALTIGVGYIPTGSNYMQHMIRSDKEVDYGCTEAPEIELRAL